MAAAAVECTGSSSESSGIEEEREEERRRRSSSSGLSLGPETSSSLTNTPSPAASGGDPSRGGGDPCQTGVIQGPQREQQQPPANDIFAAFALTLARAEKQRQLSCDGTMDLGMLPNQIPSMKSSSSFSSSSTSSETAPATENVWKKPAEEAAMTSSACPAPILHRPMYTDYYDRIRNDSRSMYPQYQQQQQPQHMIHRQLSQESMFNEEHCGYFDNSCLRGSTTAPSSRSASPGYMLGGGGGGHQPTNHFNFQPIPSPFMASTLMHSSSESVTALSEGSEAGGACGYGNYGQEGYGNSGQDGYNAGCGYGGGYDSNVGGGGYSNGGGGHGYGDGGGHGYGNGGAGGYGMNGPGQNYNTNCQQQHQQNSGEEGGGGERGSHGYRPPRVSINTYRPMRVRTPSSSSSSTRGGMASKSGPTVAPPCKGNGRLPAHQQLTMTRHQQPGQAQAQNTQQTAVMVDNVFGPMSDGHKQTLLDNILRMQALTNATSPPPSPFL